MFDEQLAIRLAELWTRRLDGDATVDEKVEGSAVALSFTASPHVQWVFILAVIDRSQSDDSLGRLAAGSVEHILGWHGDEYIDRVEAEAARNPKFARMMTGVWRYKMSDAVWSRAESIKAAAIASGNKLYG